VNGELISSGANCEMNNDDITVKDAVLNFLQDELIDEWENDCSVTRNFAEVYKNLDDLSNYVIRHNKNVIKEIEKIFDIENRINDFSIPESIFGNFKFYPLSTYSAICNIPDDIKPDWLDAAKKMIDLMEEHKDLVEDPENLFESAKERILDLKAKELAKEFMDTILYDNDYINREEPFNEEKHYGNWVEKIAGVIKPTFTELNFEFFTNEFIEYFAVGDDETIGRCCDDTPCLIPLNHILNDYFDWLGGIA
jgi:hypothetical protein